MNTESACGTAREAPIRITSRLVEAFGGRGERVTDARDSEGRLRQGDRIAGAVSGGCDRRGRMRLLDGASIGRGARVRVKVRAGYRHFSHNKTGYLPQRATGRRRNRLPGPLASDFFTAPDGCVHAAVRQHSGWRGGACALGHIRQAPGRLSATPPRREGGAVT